MQSSTPIYLNVASVLALLALYAFVASLILPDGINADFTGTVWKWALPMSGVAALGFGWRYMLSRQKNLMFQRNLAPSFSPGTLLLLLLPMTPIVEYVISNQQILSTWESGLIVACFFLVSLVLGIIIPILAPSWMPRRALMFASLSFLFVLFGKASMAAHFHWHQIGSFAIQVSIWVGVFVVGFWFYAANKRLLYALLTVFFLVNSSSTILLQGADLSGEKVEEGGSNLSTKLKARELAHSPDVFLMVYDSYVGNETLLHYGIDNSAHEEYLREYGFHVYHGRYSIGSNSIDTMSRMLDVAYDIEGNARVAPAGDGTVQRIFREDGYRTFGVFPTNYFLRGVGSYYDETIPLPAAAEQQMSSFRLLMSSIWEGEFRFDAELQHVGSAQDEKWKRKALARAGDAPRFLYTHDLFPGHSQNSGQCMEDEVEIYRRNLSFANREMMEDLAVIEEHHPQAIVIIAGDHGPYLTGDCWRLMNHEQSEITRVHLQDRYGAFLAIRWPDGADIDHASIRVLQDVFPVVFSYLYDDPGLLGARVQPVTDGISSRGVQVRDGIIEGGVHDEEHLFDTSETEMPLP